MQRYVLNGYMTDQNTDSVDSMSHNKHNETRFLAEVLVASRGAHMLVHLKCLQVTTTLSDSVCYPTGILWYTVN